jgi:flagellar biosynthesis GTPase FlhF
MECVKKEYSNNYKSVKSREYNEDPFKYALSNFRSCAFNSKRYAESQEIRDKKKEYNKRYWAQKQLAKISA